MEKNYENYLRKLTSQIKNPRENYYQLTDELLELITTAEVATIKHRTEKRNIHINDNNLKEIYMAKSIMHNVLLILGWDEKE
jgi:hypothetical protein